MLQKVKASVVIGANYGDEGKGATTHWLCKTTGAKDIFRFNGGQQAGHTVQIAKGPRHVFHTYGSGSLLPGVNTWYTRDVIYNPLDALAERTDIKRKVSHAVSPLYVPVNCALTTPWDVALNRFAELRRGANQHGSCGQGIGETVYRSLLAEDQKAPFLSVGNLHNDSALPVKTLVAWYRKRVDEITAEIPLNLSEGVEDVRTPEFWLSSETLGYMDMKFMQYPGAYRLSALFPGPFTAKAKHVVYEGAQGLLLDEDDPDHQPHVTWSKTGLKNVLNHLQTTQGEDLDLDAVYYVTRPYLTRHGAGPILAGKECEDLWDEGDDKTNRHNVHQGSIRFAHLDWKKLKDRIEKDFSQAPFGTKLRLVITHLDQICNQDTYKFHFGDEVTEFEAVDEDYFLKLVQGKMNMEVVVLDGRKG